MSGVYGPLLDKKIIGHIIYKLCNWYSATMEMDMKAFAFPFCKSI